MSETGPGRAPKKILLYRLGSLGDTVVALPAFHLVERAFPEAERRLLTSFPPNAKAPASSAVLEGTGLTHGYFRYNYGTRNVVELIRLWWQLLRWRPDVLVYMSGRSSIAAARRNALFLKLCGAPHMVGVPLTEEMQHCRREPDLAEVTAYERGQMYEHESARLVRNLAELGDARLDDPESWDLRLTPAERVRAAEALASLSGAPFFAVSFGTKNQSNDWEPQNWHALLARMAVAYPGHGLVLCGAPVEAELSEAAAGIWRQHSQHSALNLCGQLSPRESAAVFERAQAFLGHDSGPMHLAAAVQTPCVGIYGSRNFAGIWFPYGKKHRVLYHHVDCEGCRLQTCIVEQKKCVLSITADEVLAALAKTLPIDNGTTIEVI